MEITSVRARKVDRENSNMKGKAEVVIDDCFVVKVRIIETSKGLTIAMPSKRNADGTHTDLAHPINAETRAMFEKAVLEAYETAE